MGKRWNVSAGISGVAPTVDGRDGVAPVDASDGRHPPGSGRRPDDTAIEDEGEAGDAIDVKEHLSRDLARVRAKFSMDTPPGKPSLTSAWMSDVILEEYEAEFVDTMADCLGAGLSLQDALTCWDTGDLAADVADDSDPAALEEDLNATLLPPSATRRVPGAHRVFVR